MKYFSREVDQRQLHEDLYAIYILRYQVDLNLTVVLCSYDRRRSERGLWYNDL